tara:strand:+ start:854 stop:1237 length:384 start_codon:yes stop_codon:yes gene_type:complete
MSWEETVSEHRLLWRFARVKHPESAYPNGTDQDPISFEEGGEWLNSFMIDAPPGVGDDEYRNLARICAEQTHVWNLHKGASLVNGVTEEAAIKSLADGYAVLNSKLKDMGDIQTACYVIDIGGAQDA